MIHNSDRVIAICLAPESVIMGFYCIIFVAILLPPEAIRWKERLITLQTRVCDCKNKCQLMD